MKNKRHFLAVTVVLALASASLLQNSYGAGAAAGGSAVGAGGGHSGATAGPAGPAGLGSANVNGGANGGTAMGPNGTSANAGTGGRSSSSISPNSAGNPGTSPGNYQQPGLTHVQPGVSNPNRTGAIPTQGTTSGVTGGMGTNGVTTPGTTY